MTGELAVSYRGRAHMDAQKVADLVAPVFASAARPALGAGYSQASNELFAQRS